jgi:nitrogen-specific signal transduction histidine kinase/DNA-binding NarL/FixJ family response regulator
VAVLVENSQKSVVSRTRRVRVLIASADPERIMLVRESLHAWPETVVCRVAVNREDALQHIESDAPHLLCWDIALGTELPAEAHGVRTLLLGEDSCTLVEEPSWAMTISDDYAEGLRQSINREYELRRLLMQLRDAYGTETQSRLLLARATDGFIVLDRAKRVLFANTSARSLLGSGPDALVGERFEHAVPEEGKTASIEATLPDGRCVPLTATAIVSIWDGQEATIVQLQPALRPSAPPSTPPGASVPGVSEDRLRAVGRLAAGLAHEVNNPLTFVLANLESLRESHQAIRRFVRQLRVDLASREAITPQSFEQIVDDSNLQEVIDDAADMLTDCYKGMHRIQDIARSLGTFSRADHDHAEMVDITQVVDDACAMVFSQIRYRARLVKRFEPIPMVAAYPGRIAQALVNLLTNAAEAIEGGAYDKHRIVVSTRATDEHIVIAVRDSGDGIREEHRDRIFTAGFTTKASRGGMGVGLASCQRVADDHDGRLEVHHLPQGGTMFELIIPIDTGLAVSETRRESRPVSDAPMSRARLLIVDDDAMVLSALRRRLHRRFDVVTVLGGEEALALLAADPDFDSIVCDLMMPKVDGKSFYEAVQAEHPELTERIVFMSGGAFTPRLRKFAASVSNPMLQKPVSREELERMLSAYHRDPPE